MKILIESSGLFLQKCGIQRYAEEIIYGLLKQFPQDNLKLLPLTEISKRSAQLKYFFDNKEINEQTIQTNFTSFELFVSKTYAELIKKIEKTNETISTQSQFTQNHFLTKTKREFLRCMKSLLTLTLNETKFIRNRLQDINIYHQLFDFIPSDIKKINSLKKCLTIHDIIQAIRPDLMIGKDNSAAIGAKIKKIGTNETIFAVSQYTKNDLCNFNKNIDPKNVHVIHSGIANHFQPISDQKVIQDVISKYQIPKQGRFILSGFTSDPKKNVPFVIRNYLDLIKSEKIDDLFLVLTGGNKIFDNNLLKKELEIINQNKDKIILTGFVEDDEMAVLHSSCMCFCFPSLYEGFGLPVLEAMKCGAPVITSNVTSLPEIAGNAALLVDPINNDDFQTNLLKLYKDSNLRNTLSERGIQRASLFTWENAVNQMINVYHQLM
ncbi:MAG: hypothetical protein C5B43_04900 [Verrucomicrobia bacterium]|nr:MAG: hypothetical protein C5B43_04900 [Verrucomicrobiota bacterium]